MLLENDVSVLQDEVEEVETANTLQDERFLIVEGNVAENSNDIDGKLRDTSFTDLLPVCYLSMADSIEQYVKFTM